MIRSFFKKHVNFLFFKFILFSSSVVAVVPEGFEELVAKQNKKLEIYTNIDPKERVIAEFLIEGDFVKLHKSSDLTSVLSNRLGLTKEGASIAYEYLVDGVSSSRECIGFRDECIVLAEKVEFVYIDNKEELVIFVNPAFMSPTVDNNEEFIVPEVDERAFIVNHSLSYSALSPKGLKLEDDYSYYNESYLGIGDNSYFKADFDYGYSMGRNIEELSYNYLTRDKRYKIGYQSHVQNWNSTENLGSYNDFPSYLISTGNTNELKVLSESDYERYYFSTTRSGRLEVKNEQGRTLISRNVSSGTQYISYYELPQGVYDVDIKVIDGTDIVFEEKKLIINNSGYDSKIGVLDYKLTFGYLYDDWVNFSKNKNDIYDNLESLFYFEGNSAIRWSNDISLGIGVIGNYYDYYTNLSLGYTMYKDTSLNFNAGISENGSNFFQTQVRMGSVNISWRRYDKNYNSFGLSDILFYENDYESVSLSYHHTLNNNSSLYLSSYYNYFERENGGDNNNVKNASLGYSHYNLPFGAQINFDFRVNESKDRNYQYDMSATINIPIGPNHTYSHNSYFSKVSDSEEHISHRDNISSYWLNDSSKVLSTNLGFYYSKDDDMATSSDVSTSLSTINKYVKSSSYLYANTDDTRSGNIFLESNAIVTKDKVFFTTDKSDSYVVVSNSTGNIYSDDKLSPVIQEYVNDEVGRSVLLENKVEIHPLKRFKNYSFDIDHQSSDFINDGEKRVKATSFPGTVITIDTSVTELQSFISTFVDIRGGVIDSVECVGQGCVQVDRLAEGVYYFKVKESLPYKIISSDGDCVIQEINNVESGNLGENFCMPSFEEKYSSHKIALLSDGNYYHYLGEFSEDFIRQKNAFNSQGENVEIIIKEVGKVAHVFLQTDRALNANELSEIY